MGNIESLQTARQSLRDQIAQDKASISRKIDSISLEIGQPDHGKASGVIRLLEQQLRESFPHQRFSRRNLEATSLYKTFSALSPRTAEAAVQVVEETRQLRGRQRLDRKFTLWQEYFDDQGERDIEILRLLRETDHELNRIAQQEGLDDKQRGWQEKQTLNQSLREIRHLAPEQVIQKFLRPQSYHPRGRYKELLDEALGRMSPHIKEVLPQAVIHNKLTEQAAMIKQLQEDNHRLLAAKRDWEEAYQQLVGNNQPPEPTLSAGEKLKHLVRLTTRLAVQSTKELANNVKTADSNGTNGDHQENPRCFTPAWVKVDGHLVVLTN